MTFFGLLKLVFLQMRHATIIGHILGLVAEIAQRNPIFLSK
jgi:hypothetical protein